MAIAFSATTCTEVKAPANPVAVKGNVTYTKQFQVTVPASTTAAELDTGVYLPPGTLVLGCVIDTPTTFGATATLALATETANVVFVAAANVQTTGGQQMTIAANKGVAVPTSATADDQIQLALASAASPASDLVLTVTLVCASIVDDQSTYSTYST